LCTSYFAENLKNPFAFSVKRNDTGKIVMDIAYKTDGKLPVIAASDIGGWALVAFKEPENWIGECLEHDITLITDLYYREGHEARDRMGNPS
jgi:hypothetical protein